MDDVFVVGQAVNYYLYYRARGYPGGWKPVYHVGEIVTINGKTITVRRTTAGFSSRLETVQRNRVSALGG